MIRFLSGRSLAMLVLSLGLAVVGCNEAKSPPASSGKQDASKAQEQMEKQKEMMMKMKDQMKDKMKDKDTGGGAETTDKDKDKDKPKEGAKDK